MDGKVDYTYALRSFFPLDNVNQGQPVKIRNSYGRLTRKERRIVNGDPEEDAMCTNCLENFHVILSERSGRLAMKTKCFSKMESSPFSAVKPFQSCWNSMLEFRGSESRAMNWNLTEYLWSRYDLLDAVVKHIFRSKPLFLMRRDSEYCKGSDLSVRKRFFVTFSKS